MDENNSAVCDELQVTIYADRMGRGWRVRQLLKPVDSCYSIRCRRPAVLEMVRIAGSLARRELLCLKCFQDRAAVWEMTVKSAL